MILACPLCQTRYLLPASLFAMGPRQVRCARCSHAWKAEPPNTIDVFSIPEPVPASQPPEPPPPISPGSNLPVLHKDPRLVRRRFAIAIGIAVTALIILLILVFDRKSIAEQWPATEKLYNSIGLHIFYPGEGLVLKDVRSDLKYEDGITKLEVNGSIENMTEKSQKIPNIMASAIGSDGIIMQSWQIDAPTATLQAHEQVAFQSSINTPKGTIVNLNLNFIEPKNADE